MEINNIIKYPILSEKTYVQMENGVYTFAVDPRTNKVEVKKAIEFIFDVKVGKVNIFNVPAKVKKVGRSQGLTNHYKKAIVTITEGQINIFPEDAAANVEASTDKKETKTKVADKEMSDAEKRAADKIAAKAKAKEAEAKPAAKAEAKPAPKAEAKETPKAKEEAKPAKAEEAPKAKEEVKGGE